MRDFAVTRVYGDGIMCDLYRCGGATILRCEERRWRSLCICDENVVILFLYKCMERNWYLLEISMLK